MEYTVQRNRKIHSPYLPQNSRKATLYLGHPDLSGSSYIPFLQKHRQNVGGLSWSIQVHHIWNKPACDAWCVFEFAFNAAASSGVGSGESGVCDVTPFKSPSEPRI